MVKRTWAWETLEGMVVAQRYELCRHLATGGMAAIFRGRDRVLGRQIAIKVVLNDDETGKLLLRRFRCEALIGAAMQHPHIIKIFDFVEEEHFAFLCLELIEGIDLKKYINLHGPLAIANACSIGIQVCQALSEMHTLGFIHRDIKPQNILLDATGCVKLADFGIVQSSYEHSFSIPGMVLGTAAYLPPEQALGDILTPQTDLYALGVVLYEMVTGALPFTGPTAIAVALQHVLKPVPPLRLQRSDIPSALENIILRALSKKPEHRFPSAQSLGEALQLHAAHLDIAAIPYAVVDEHIGVL